MLFVSNLHHLIHVIDQPPVSTTLILISDLSPGGMLWLNFPNHTNSSSNHL
jgi:hypothetical protein